MSRLLVLETFDGAAPADFSEMPFAGPDSAPAMPEEALPDEPPPADGEEYERGYRAGWDDCERQAREARESVGAELSRNIQELGFTYHEARAHVLSALEPLLSGMVRKVLPDLAAQTLGQSVVEEVAAMAGAAADAPVTILVSPQSHDMIADFLAGATALPYRLVAEPTLTDWQVHFRLGEHERQLDLDGVIGRIGERLAAFSDQNQKVLKHG